MYSEKTKWLKFEMQFSNKNRTGISSLQANISIT